MAKTFKFQGGNTNLELTLFLYVLLLHLRCLKIKEMFFINFGTDDHLCV
jgi:hypothetical protein